MPLKALRVLQRAAGGGSRGSRRQRRAGGSEQRWRALPEIQAAVRDVEAAPAPRRRCVPEAVHGMHCCDYDDDEPGSRSLRSINSERSRFFRFYKNKVRELQDKAGDIDHCPITGNLYLYRALAHFGDTSGLFQDKASPLVMVGLVIVVICQLLGPIAILFYCAHRIEFSPNGRFFGLEEAMKYKSGSLENGLSYCAQRLLGVFFLLLFSANGLFVLRQDKESTKKVSNMCKVFRQAASVSDFEPPQEVWLYLGAFVNGLCLVLCCFCMVFLFILAEDGPKDVLFDAFGLTFLYNLDDVKGDLAFLDEKWDEDQMGDIYGMLADELDLMNEIEMEDDGCFTAGNIFQLWECIVLLLIPLLPLVFLFVEMKPKET